MQYTKSSDRHDPEGYDSKIYGSCHSTLLSDVSDIEHLTTDTAKSQLLQLDRSFFAILVSSVCD
jgi:hypothetical protein